MAQDSILKEIIEKYGKLLSLEDRLHTFFSGKEEMKRIQQIEGFWNKLGKMTTLLISYSDARCLSLTNEDY